MDFQARNNIFHISKAGRGKEEQEQAFKKGFSRARWGESAHNYGFALDFFELAGDKKNIYEVTFFQIFVVEMQKNPDLLWYGHPKSSFREYPHVEVASWKKIVERDNIPLVTFETITHVDKPIS